jgi:peroxiredoxin
MNKYISHLIALQLFAFLIANAQVAPSADKICPILIGEKIPSVDLTNSQNETISTDKIIKEKKTVFIIYRGGWCPYCNKHMSDLARVEGEINKIGYQIVAVSTDSPKSLKETEEKFKFKYRLLSDRSGKFIKALRLAFKAPADYEKVITNASEGENKEFLPVPAIFVTNNSGEVIFEYVNPDFKKRISGGMLVSVLSSL